MVLHSSHWTPLEKVEAMSQNPLSPTFVMHSLARRDIFPDATIIPGKISASFWTLHDTGLRMLPKDLWT